MRDNENYLRVIPMSRELIARAGRWGLYENIFLLERVSARDKEGTIIQVTYQNLLPARPEYQYISVNEACQRTGMSENEIVALCEEGLLEAKKVRGEWVVHLGSLERYFDEDAPA